MWFEKTKGHFDRATHRRWRVATLCLLAGFTADVGVGHASSGIVLETISDYTFLCGDHSCDTDANTEGNGFWNAMTASGTGWTGTHHYMDNLVYDTDFEDPQYTGLSDNDTNNFDS